MPNQTQKSNRGRWPEIRFFHAMKNLLILKMEKNPRVSLVFGLKSYIFNVLTTSDVFLYTVFSVGCNVFSNICILKWENT